MTQDKKQKIITLIEGLGAAYGAIFGGDCLDEIASEIIEIIKCHPPQLTPEQWKLVDSALDDLVKRESEQQ